MNDNPAAHDPGSLNLFGVSELARELGVSRHTIYSWVAQRRIPYLKVGRLLRFERRAIAAWLHGDRAEASDLESLGTSHEDGPRCGTRPQRR